MARFFIIIIIIISHFWIFFFPPQKFLRFFYWVLACRPKNLKDALKIYILSYAVYRQICWLNCLNDDHYFKYFTYSSVGRVSKWYPRVLSRYHSCIKHWTFTSSPYEKSLWEPALWKLWVYKKNLKIIWYPTSIVIEFFYLFIYFKREPGKFFKAFLKTRSGGYHFFF